MSLKTFPSLHPDRRGYRWRTEVHLSSAKQGSQNHVLSGMLFGTLSNCFNEKGVVKVRISNSVTENEWSNYVKSCNTGHSFVADFNKIFQNDSGRSITFVAPSVAVFDNVSRFAKFSKKLKRTFRKNECVLIEQYISGTFQRFTPFNPKISTEDLECIEAFSHLTFLMSRRNFIVCNLKGVRQKFGFKFTCPTIHSADKSYGPSDLGESGIDQFFLRHKCGKLCQRCLEYLFLTPVPSAPIEESEWNRHRYSGKEHQTFAYSTSPMGMIPISVISYDEMAYIQASNSKDSPNPPHLDTVQKLDFFNGNSSHPHWPSPMIPAFPSNSPEPMGTDWLPTGNVESERDQENITGHRYVVDARKCLWQCGPPSPWFPQTDINEMTYHTGRGD